MEEKIAVAVITQMLIASLGVSADAYKLIHKVNKS